jgi:hypothetical protein
VLTHTNNLLVLATCIRNARECGNILQVREKRVMRQSDENLKRIHGYRVGRHNVFGIATGYGLGGLGIETRCGQDFPHLSRPTLGPTQSPVQWVLGLLLSILSWVFPSSRPFQFLSEDLFGPLIVLHSLQVQEHVAN